MRIPRLLSRGRRLRHLPVPSSLPPPGPAPPAERDAAVWRFSDPANPIGCANPRVSADLWVWDVVERMTPVKYSTRYPKVWRGMHAPDNERLYRTQEQRPCAKCGAMTDWTDIMLEQAVCSEECQHELATGSRRVKSRPDPGDRST